MRYYIIGYAICGYISALIYYIKYNEFNGKPIENKESKAFTLFLFWPFIIVAVILLIPFFEHKYKKIANK